MGRRRRKVSSSTYPCLTQSGVSPRLTVWLVAVVQMILVRRRFGGSTKRVKTFVAPMGMKAPSVVSNYTGTIPDYA